MTLGLVHSLPRWLIDDTASIGDGRVFVMHTQEPRFIGELMPADEAELEGITLSAGDEVLCRILWLDEPQFDADELCRSLTSAVERHWSIREGEPPP